MAVEKSIKTLRENLVSEAIDGDGDQSHAVKAASFVKTFGGKRGYAEGP